MATLLERHHEQHPQNPTAHFAKFHEAITERAHRSAAELARRARGEHDATDYHRATEQPTGA